MFLCGWRTNIIISLEVFYCKLKHFQPPAEQVVYLFGYILILYIQVFFLPNGALPQQSERIASSAILLIALPAGPRATRPRYTKTTAPQYCSAVANKAYANVTNRLVQFYFTECFFFLPKTPVTISRPPLTKRSAIHNTM